MRPTRDTLRAFICSLLASTAWGQSAIESAQPETPNAVFQISERLISQMLSMTVNRTVQVRESVLGTAVRGTTTTAGSVSPVLIPNLKQGMLQIRFQGTARSPRMVGQNGPATIISSAVSSVDVRKNVILNDRGIQLLPASAEVTTRLSIDDVSARRRIVNRIARRRAERSQGAAQAVTQQKTRARLQEEVDRDAAAPLSQAQEYFLNGFRHPLEQRNALPKLFRFATTSDHLRLSLLQCCHSNCLPPTTLPWISPEHDIAVALHESSIGSIYEVFFAGKESDDREVLHTVHLLTGEDPRELRVHDRTPRWSITFADARPLTVTFRDGSARISMHLKALRYGDRRYDGDFTVAVQFELEKTARGPRLNRIGDLVVDGRVDSDSPGELATALTILRSKFGAVFPPMLTFDGLVPPTGGVWDIIGQLQLVQLDAEEGWLVMGHQTPRPVTLVAGPRPRR